MPAAKSVGFYQSTAVSGSTSLATVAGGTVPATADYAVVQAETQDCRYRHDGSTTAPTATVGTLLKANDSIVVSKGQFSTFRIIETAASAKLNVEFFKGD